MQGDRHVGEGARWETVGLWDGGQSGDALGGVNGSGKSGGEQGLSGMKGGTSVAKEEPC